MAICLPHAHTSQAMPIKLAPQSLKSRAKTLLGGVLMALICLVGIGMLILPAFLTAIMIATHHIK